MPVCTIVIPVLNEGSVLADCLLRLQSLRTKNVEIIVADGGSIDGSLEAVASLVDVVVAAPRGRAVQMNAGAAKASADIILFLHADTVLPESFINLLETFSDSSLLWGFFTPRLSGSHGLLRFVEKGMSWRSRLTHVATGDQAIFVRRELFNQLGGFPELALMEDVAFSKLLRRVAQPLVWPDPVITSSRRWEQNGIVKTILLMWWLRLLYVCGVAPATLQRLYYKKSVDKKLPVG
jgi:rSAM/selenodomain-associated transferase 2